MLLETGLFPGMGKLNEFSGYIATCPIRTTEVHKFCNLHELLLRLMSFDALVHLQMSTEYLGKSCKAVCLAKQTKVKLKVQELCNAELVAYPLMNIIR